MVSLSSISHALSECFSGSAAQVNHPSICKLLGISVDQQHYTLVLEYVSGNEATWTGHSCHTLLQAYISLTPLNGIAPGTNLFDYLHKLHKTIPIGKQLGVSVQVSGIRTSCGSARQVPSGLGRF